jgi:hypothetical protein
LESKVKEESMDDGTASPISNAPKTPEAVLEPILEEPKKPARKPRKVKEPAAEKNVVKKVVAKKKEETSIKDFQLKDSVFFPMLLATKRQLDKEARTARISNLRIV